MLSTADRLEEETHLVLLAANEKAPPVFPVVPSQRTAAKRRARIDWYAWLVVLLMLASAAACFYRIFWTTLP